MMFKLKKVFIKRNNLFIIDSYKIKICFIFCYNYRNNNLIQSDF